MKKIGRPERELTPREVAIQSNDTLLGLYTKRLNQAGFKVLRTEEA